MLKRKYSVEEKIQICIDKQVNGLSNAQLALKYSIPKTNIRDWTRDYEKLGESAFKRELKRENNSYTSDFRIAVVGYNISDRPVFAQVVDMLNKAFEKIPNNTKLILHTDRGWQYQMKNYQNMLREKGIIQSMSQKGNCLDNSLAENFFSQLKAEFLYIQEFNSVEQFKQELIEYIEYYNTKRIKTKLKASPVAYRLKNAA